MLKRLNRMGVDIDTAGVENLMTSVEGLRQNMQITEEDVTGAFEAIKDTAVGAFTDVKNALTGAGASMDLLGGDVLSIGANFDNMGDSASSAGDKAKGGADEAKNAFEKAKDKADEYEKKVKKLEDTTEKYKNKHKDFYDDIQNSIREVDTLINDNIASYDKLISKIQEEGQAKLKTNSQEFFTKQAQTQVALEAELVALDRKIQYNQQLAQQEGEAVQTGELQKQANLYRELVTLQQLARDFTAETTKEEADKNIARQATIKQLLDELENNKDINDATKTQLELTRERLEIIQQISEIEANLKSETGAESGVNFEEIQAIARRRQASSSEGSDYFDFDDKRRQIENETQLELDKAEAEFEAEQAKLNRKKEIYNTYLTAQLEDTKAINVLLEEENLRKASIEEQQLILKLEKERQAVKALYDEQVTLEAELLATKDDMIQTATNLMLQQGSKVRSDVEATINKINQAIARMNELRSMGSGGGIDGARMNGGTVDAGKSYLVGEE